MRSRASSGLTLVIRRLEAPSALDRSVLATIEVSLDSPYEVQSAQIDLRAAHEGRIDFQDTGPLARQFVYRPWFSRSFGALVQADVFVKPKNGVRRTALSVFGVGTRVVRLSAELPAVAFSPKSTVSGTIIVPGPSGTTLDQHLSVRLESTGLGISSVFYPGRDGRYYFYGVPAGHYRLKVERSDFAALLAITVLDQPHTKIPPVDFGRAVATARK